MAPWLLPALKAVLPHLGTIISAAAPVFTRKKTPEPAEHSDALVQQQIAELQAAAGQNADHVRELAARLQDTVSALEQGAAQAETRLRRTLWLSVAAGAFAAAVTTIILLAFLPR